MGAPLWRRVFWAPALWALAAESVFVSDDVPAQAVLRTRYQGVSVRVELAGVLRTATLRSDASATALTLEACAEQRVCATVANARLVRAAASAAAQAADPTGLGKLAWELEETRAEVGEAHAGAAHVGIFVIHLTDDAALDLLARSLRAAFPPPLEGGGLTQLTAPRLHVLCGPSPNTQGYDPSFWLERFQGRRALLGGVHLMTNANPFAPAAQRSHQGNYMAKACAMPRIAALQGYDHVVSSDDDVIVPAHAWRAFAWAAAAPRAGAPARLGAAGCTVATPLIHNAVPTGRSFAERALGGDAVRALDACFSSSSLGYVGKIHMDQIPQPISPWNESFWWDKLAGVEGVFKGGHPIRWNRRCMTLSLELALAHVGKWWDRDLDAAPAAGLEVHGPGAKPYPYFTNTLWMSTAKHYAAALDRYDLFVDRYDEVPLNLYTIQERHGALCTLPGAFVVHPAYNYVRDKSNRIQEAACLTFSRRER
ncbi:hypothetical protein M885DRAFT_502454 [Pelagophyceae sp. CCMP2097]|nr:hypothetical protein M885DRAFT_502454 [Pelagophyceae sp. CCMP2097]